MYAAKKDALTRQYAEHDAAIRELEQKLNASGTGTVNLVIERFKGYETVDTLTDELSVELLDRITLYSGGVMDVRLNYADELETLRETINKTTKRQEIKT